MRQSSVAREARQSQPFYEIATLPLAVRNDYIILYIITESVA